MKKGIIFLFIVVSFISAHGQSKFGENPEDSILCITNISLYQDAYKEKKFIEAFQPWRWVFLNCPASSQNIYKHGPTILKKKMEENAENKTSYADTLMLLYDQRIKYFGKEGYVLGKKGSDFRRYYRSRYEEAYHMLKKSIELQKESTEANALLNYFRSCIDMQKNNKLTNTDLSEAYVASIRIIEYNLSNIFSRVKKESSSKKINQLNKKASSYLQALEKINKLFSCENFCSQLLAVYESRVSEFSIDPPEVNLLQRITLILSHNNCMDSETYFQAATRLYDLDPSAASASEMGKMNISRKNYSLAIDYFKEAISSENQIEIKAKYYLELADALRISGSYSSARDAVYSALEIRPNWGEAYLLLGNIYVAGAASCGTEFEQSTVYWIAVDSFRRALKDDDAKERAAKKINTYSRYFPTTDECFFNANVTSGQSYTIGCWINKTTQVRTSD